MLCIDVPMNEPFKKVIFIGSHKQQIQYKADNYLCKYCGHLGHRTIDYQERNIAKKDLNPPQMEKTKYSALNTPDEGWQTVNFLRRRRIQQQKSNEVLATKVQTLGNNARFSNPTTSLLQITNLNLFQK